jgi:hypothetical protein
MSRPLALAASAVGEKSRLSTRPGKIGLYKDWPMSKGCIIPYAPTAIDALAKRKK